MPELGKRLEKQRYGLMGKIAARWLLQNAVFIH